MPQPISILKQSGCWQAGHQCVNKTSEPAKRRVNLLYASAGYSKITNPVGVSDRDWSGLNGHVSACLSGFGGVFAQSGCTAIFSGVLFSGASLRADDLGGIVGPDRPQGALIGRDGLVHAGLIGLHGELEYRLPGYIQVFDSHWRFGGGGDSTGDCA